MVVRGSSAITLIDSHAKQNLTLPNVRPSLLTLLKSAALKKAIDKIEKVKMFIFNNFNMTYNFGKQRTRIDGGKYAQRRKGGGDIDSSTHQLLCALLISRQEWRKRSPKIHRGQCAAECWAISIWAGVRLVEKIRHLRRARDSVGGAQWRAGKGEGWVVESCWVKQISLTGGDPAGGEATSPRVKVLGLGLHRRQQGIAAIMRITVPEKPAALSCGNARVRARTIIRDVLKVSCTGAVIRVWHFGMLMILGLSGGGSAVWRSPLLPPSLVEKE
ncbi:hypothetical protein HPP92_006474 [Vanilla planifolia]|uniref:Uncharacterized protein n=1 Tax=Vanilla planifolia TaxID=51239 RepID=A0A835VAZ0_VANPL|nr:hypothetical protein HPP92_006735 [Vanilla planifolia]KAG0489611.1 hypothetical protein HPP92_006474 [Vanilla planifolia]